jgi:hypothetical protein
LPLGAGADCKIDRRRGLVHATKAPVPALLPILTLVPMLVVWPGSTFNERTGGVSNSF